MLACVCPFYTALSETNINDNKKNFLSDSTVPSRYLLRDGTVPSRYFLCDGTVPSRYSLQDGTVPSPNHYQIFIEKKFLFEKKFCLKKFLHSATKDGSD